MTTRGKGGPPGLYDLDGNDPEGVLIDRSGLTPEDVEQIGELMNAMARLRDTERELARAGERYMRLGRTDMRALHYVIVNMHRGTPVTPGMIARHLGITTASTTKLLDRLERGGHIVRRPHESDRRALTVAITPETYNAAMRTSGRMQASRFAAAARLTAEERSTVIGFLRETTSDLREVLGDQPEEG